MQNHVQITGADTDRGTDFVTFQFNEFTHHEDPPLFYRQMGQAGLKYLPELLILNRGFGITPRGGLILGVPMSVRIEQTVGPLALIILVGDWTDRYHPLTLTKQIGDFVLEDGEHPGFQSRSSTEGLGILECTD